MTGAMCDEKGRELANRFQRIVTSDAGNALGREKGRKLTRKEKYVWMMWDLCCDLEGYV